MKTKDTLTAIGFALFAAIASPAGALEILPRDAVANTVAIGDDKILNREGLRYPQEFVRHKFLDAVGDLALAGHPILGAYRSVRGGHRLNAHVLQALLADPTAWTMVQAARVREQSVFRTSPIALAAGE